MRLRARSMRCDSRRVTADWVLCSFRNGAGGFNRFSAYFQLLEHFNQLATKDER